MTDLGLVEKKLAQIETYVRELRALADVEKIESDVKEERFAAHTLQLAIQNTLDVCSHIISDERLGEAQTNQELIEILVRNGWIPAGLAANLKNMAGFRNILVHAYEKFDLAVMIDVLQNHLHELDAFAQAVRQKLRPA
ncbi:MAG: type VII toxin-antitoxin system HepT family RNase toxin [Burkholderiales bacterium]